MMMRAPRFSSRRPPTQTESGLARHRGRLVGPHVRQLTQRDLERDRHPVQAVDGDRLLTALDLADELARQPPAITQPLLAPTALLAQGPHPLPQEFPHVSHRAFAHGAVTLGTGGKRQALAAAKTLRRASWAASENRTGTRRDAPPMMRVKGSRTARGSSVRDASPDRRFGEPDTPVDD